ncbi:MAG TPA: hypothetical protein VFO28_12985 [Burkholderiaceae bacterium]|nr:hypothetical protein [Burkholderiaceae bacterium]
MEILCSLRRAAACRLHIGAMLLCAAVLAACGGGGAGDSAEAPVPDDGVNSNDADASMNGFGIALDAPQAIDGTNRIRLTWRVNGQSGAFTHTVFVRRSAEAPFEAVDATVAGNAAEFARGAAWKIDFPTAQVRVQRCNPAQQCVDSNEQPLLDALLGGIVALQPTAVAQNAVFGNRTALSADGNTLVTAAPTDRVAGDPNFPGFGSIWVFHRGEDGRWSQQARFDKFSISNNFGEPLALSGDGNTLVVGVPSEAGAAGGINPPETGSNVFDPSGLPEQRGAVYVFVRNAQQQWSQQAFIKAAVPVLHEGFGRHIVLSHDGNRMGVAGNNVMYLFDRSGVQWRQDRMFRGNGDTLFVGASDGMAISGDGLSIAMRVSGEVPEGDLRRPYFAVHVYTKCPCGEGWKRAADLRSAKPLNLNGDEDDGFGSSLSFSRFGTTLAVGAPMDPGDATDTGSTPNRNAFDAGAIYVFGPDASGVWHRRAFLKARGAPTHDQVGRAVSLSADGQVLATKACGFAANAAGLRRNHREGDTIGRQAGDTFCFWGGSAYVFELGADNRWSHTAAAIAAPSELVSFDFFSLAFSADAQTLGLGLMSYSVAPNGRGRVAVF